ncbi:MAG: DUF2828 family protein [Firmicutes bacterium]|nr:DUF2828 family protein [Bacillota bacterium]
MLNYLKEEANRTFTEYGASTKMTTFSDNLDLFATIGALRHADNEEIIGRFQKAFIENPDLAMKNLFFGRDIRGGLGERRTFRVCMKWLADHHPASVEKNLEQFGEYGRYDDLLCLMDTPCNESVVRYIGQCLSDDVTSMESGGPVSLLAKWLPSVNASNRETVGTAKKLAKALKMKERDYRKTLCSLRAYIEIIENNLRERDYSFDYEKQPSKALFKYRAAFLRNDEKRYLSYLNGVSRGERKLNAGTLMPYDIIRPITELWGRKPVSEEERHVMDVTWKAQKDFADDTNALVVIDGSASMYCNRNPQPAAVALSLGVYFAERNKGVFRNHFITFSHNPKLVEVKGRDIVDKVKYCMGFNEISDTNIQKVFELILQTALKHKVPQEELPKTVYIVTDMEFNACAKYSGMTNFEYAKQLFSAHGYQLPQIVFWNVDSRNRQQPVTMNEQGVILVSGCSPRIFSMVMDHNYSPYEFMMEVLGSERYAGITA